MKKFILTLLLFPILSWGCETVDECIPLAEAGDAEAQYQVARSYYYGEGVPQDYAEALHWVRKAAEQGNVNAQHGLGVAYAFGRGAAQDYTKALTWYRKAANQGDANAQFNIGWSYRWGKGVPQDFLEAYSWWSLAAANGDEYAIGSRDSLAKQLSRTDLAAAQRRASQLYEQINQ